MPVFLLSDRLFFPPPALARKDGLLAVGGDLSQERLRLAYRMGIFPWFSNGDPILWWSPDPRLVLYPSEIGISKSLKKVIRKGVFRVSMDTAFERVIQGCAQVRFEKDEGTWITAEMIGAYCRLHNILKEIADGEELKLQWWNIEMVERDIKEAKKAYKECF